MSNLAAASSEAEVTGNDKTLFGFWLYIMTDCVLFASLFAVYAVLHRNNYGGPVGSDLFKLPFVLKETLILLSSSFTCGLALISAQNRNLKMVIFWFLVTFALGASFLGLELNEFHRLVLDGNSWRRSGFLSGYFTLVGTHGLHITVGLIWMATMLIRLFRHGFNENTLRRLTMLGMFWHFLDVVWIFIFTVVYLFGVIGV